MRFHFVHLSTEHSTQTHGVVADVYVLLDLTHPLGHDLAHLEGHEHAQGLEVAPKLLPYLPDNLPPVRRRDLGPHLPRLLARPHTRLVVLHCPGHHASDGLTIGGAQRGHNLVFLGLGSYKDIICPKYLSGSFPLSIKHPEVLVLEAEVLEELILAALVD